MLFQSCAVISGSLRDAVRIAGALAPKGEEMVVRGLFPGKGGEGLILTNTDALCLSNFVYLGFWHA